MISIAWKYYFVSSWMQRHFFIFVFLLIYTSPYHHPLRRRHRQLRTANHSWNAIYLVSPTVLYISPSWRSCFSLCAPYVWSWRPLFSACLMRWFLHPSRHLCWVGWRCRYSHDHRSHLCDLWLSQCPFWLPSSARGTLSWRFVAWVWEGTWRWPTARSCAIVSRCQC